MNAYTQVTLTFILGAHDTRFLRTRRQSIPTTGHLRSDNPYKLNKQM